MICGSQCYTNSLYCDVSNARPKGSAFITVVSESYSCLTPNTIQGLKRESLLSLNHDQRFNRNEHLDKGRLRFHDGSIQIPTKCDLAKGRLGFNEPEPIQG